MAPGRLHWPAALLLAALPSALGTTLPRVGVRDGKFVDAASGHELFFRGVNVVYKDPPYFPHVPFFHTNLSFTEGDVDLLRSLGVNLIRLGVMWPGVMPRKGQVCREYLTAIDGIIELAASRGMYTIVEPHQDELHPLFCGEGLPDWWAAEYLQVKDFPVPLQAKPYPMTPPTFETCLTHSTFTYLWTHDIAKAFQTVWDNPEGLADYWRVISARYRGNPNVLAAEIWNEPFMGDYFNKPWLRDNQKADRENLQPFYEAMEKVIHSPEGDPDMLIAYEPSWPVGTQDIEPQSLLTTHSGFDSLPGKNPIYSFHYYSPPCDGDVDRHAAERVVDAQRLGAVPIVTEFNLGDVSTIGHPRLSVIRTFEAFESRFVSIVGWQYKSFVGSLPNGTCTGCGNSLYRPNGQLSPNGARAIARPLAQEVAGRAISRHLHLESGYYRLSYIADGGHGKTRIFLPGMWHPGEIEVTVQVTPANGGEPRSSGNWELKVEPGKQISPRVEQHTCHQLLINGTAASQGEKVVVEVRPMKATVLYM